MPESHFHLHDCRFHSMSGKLEHVVLKAIGGFVILISAEITDDSAPFADNEYAGLKEFYCGNHFLTRILLLTFPLSKSCITVS